MDCHGNDTIENLPVVTGPKTLSAKATSTRCALYSEDCHGNDAIENLPVDTLSRFKRRINLERSGMQLLIAYIFCGSDWILLLWALESINALHCIYQT